MRKGICQNRAMKEEARIRAFTPEDYEEVITCGASLG